MAQATTSKEEARRQAEALAEQKRQTERAYRKPLERVMRQNAEDDPGWNRSANYIGNGEDEL